MRRLFALVCLAAPLALPAAAAAQDPAAALRSALASSMRSAGRSSGAYVINATEVRRLYEQRADTARVLASNTKVFTTAAALARLGPAATLKTRLLGTGFADGLGTWQGNL